MSEKLDLDWFPLKWQKFVIGTSNMKADEIGGYILLLIREWDKGFLPNDIIELSKVSKLSSKKLSKVLEKFENIDGKLYNETLEIIRIEQQEKAEKSTNKGIKGAKARWDKHRKGKAKEIPEHSLTNSIREEENRQDKNRQEESEIVAPELNFNYMIDGKEVLSVEETFKEKFPVLLNDLKSKHGELKIKKWIGDFSTLHKQKSWKDFQDFRHHISSFIRLSSEKKDNESTKNTVGADGNIEKFGTLG